MRMLIPSMVLPTWARADFDSDLLKQMDHLVGDFEGEQSLTWKREKDWMTPSCDVLESKDRFLLSLDLPGIKKEDVKIEISDKTLTISGERKRETSSDKNEKIQRIERSYGIFNRVFTLPDHVDTSKVDARFENGVLEINVPIIQEAKPRMIEILS